MVFRSPKYYAELRKYRREKELKLTSSQASSSKAASPEPKAQASSQSPQAPGSKSRGTSEPSPYPGYKQQG
jgi:hypothetical protein